MNCKECPWIVSNNHNENWKLNVEKMQSIGKIKDRKHKCHMISNDIWGYSSEIDESNVCFGSIKKI